MMKENLCFMKNLQYLWLFSDGILYGKVFRNKAVIYLHHNSFYGI